MLVPALDYSPRPGHGYDVEVLAGARLRAVAGDHPRWVERMNFHVMLYLTRRGYTHMIDFESHHSEPGTLLTVLPGQVHRFGDMSRLHGWMLMFRSEVLTPGLASVELESCVRFEREDRAAFEECLRRIEADTKAQATPELQALVAVQVHALVLRAGAMRQRADQASAAERAAVDRVRRYRAAVDRDHAHRRTVAGYARKLGCSPKTLTRACQDVLGMSPKAILAARIALEAKRLLAHTAMPVGEIADALGFSEATNFVKFFCREAGCTPGAFRRSQTYDGRDAAMARAWTRELARRVGASGG